ncbi:MAG: MBL fold metallo-hydrolase [Burkholderiaceae bacterium]|nr:MBL fold metallo-hydrolase [Burkholderiaceae bacterium]
MNEAEARLHYPLGETLPTTTQALDVAPGVKWIRMALPFALNHINLWLLRDRLEVDGHMTEGWTIVDCCIDAPSSREQWQHLFDHELEGLPVLRVLVTHMHPDHVGLAHWLVDHWSTPSYDCPLWMSGLDFAMAHIGSAGGTGFGGNDAAAFFAMHGLNNPDDVAKVRARENYYGSLVPRMPKAHTRLFDGLMVRIGAHQWRCMVGYGHAPEHMALYCSELDVLIGGDMMLPRISTNVSVYASEPESNPLQLFLDSLDRMRALPDSVLILPSHGKPFKGLHERINQLVAHHQDRLAEVLQACRERPLNAAQVLPVLFKRALDLHQTTFAMGESVAHLHLLWFEGKLRRFKQDDVWLWQAT